VLFHIPKQIKKRTLCYIKCTPLECTGSHIECSWILSEKYDKLTKLVQHCSNLYKMCEGTGL